MVSPDPGRFLLIGGRLCVDFANTAPTPGAPRGTLGDFDDLVAFLVAAGAVGRQEARQLRRGARARPRHRTAAFAGALQLRVTLRALLAARAARAPVRRAWVDQLNRILRLDRSRPQLVARAGGWALAPVSFRPDPLGALVPVARSAAELIQEGVRAPVRRCGHPRCVLFYYDTSPAGRRRWCSMAVCGNRMKVAAHARRRRRPC